MTVYPKCSEWETFPPAARELLLCADAQCGEDLAAEFGCLVRDLGEIDALLRRELYWDMLWYVVRHIAVNDGLLPLSTVMRLGPAFTRVA